MRNPALSGCGAPVRNDTSAACPPSTSGWLTPLNTVKSSRRSASGFRYRDSSYPRPVSFGKKYSGMKPMSKFTAASRRGTAAVASDGALANAGRIASRNGSANDAPAARSTVRRERACGMVIPV